MVEYSSFEVPIDYSNNDKYIRAIRFSMIRSNGDIKISAFKSNKGGVSVTRSNDAYLGDALAYMNAHFEGRMAVFRTTACAENGVYEKHSPSPGHNQHHWELYGDANESELSLSQIVALIKESRFM